MQTFAPKAQRRVSGFADHFPPAAFAPIELSVEQWVSAAAVVVRVPLGQCCTRNTTNHRARATGECSRELRSEVLRTRGGPFLRVFAVPTSTLAYLILYMQQMHGCLHTNSTYNYHMYLVRSSYPTTAHSYSIAHSPRCPSKNIIADFVASCQKHGLRPAFYYSVHENWYYNVSAFNLTDPKKQQAFEDMAMHQLAEIQQIFVDAGADVAEIWFDAGVRQSDAFVQRVNDFVAKQLPSTATCHSCGNMPDVHAVSWMGNEETRMSYPMWNANTDTLDYLGSQGKPFGIPDGTRWVPAHCDAVLRRHFWFWADNYNSSANLNTVGCLLRETGRVISPLILQTSAKEACWAEQAAAGNASNKRRPWLQHVCVPCM